MRATVVAVLLMAGMCFRNELRAAEVEAVVAHEAWPVPAWTEARPAPDSRRQPIRLGAGPVPEGTKARPAQPPSISTFLRQPSAGRQDPAPLTGGHGPDLRGGQEEKSPARWLFCQRQVIIMRDAFAGWRGSSGILPLPVWRPRGLWPAKNAAGCCVGQRRERLCIGEEKETCGARRVVAGKFAPVACGPFSGMGLRAG